jgi:hypothetical protein
MLYEFLQWAKANGRVPDVAMGASVGGYAAADLATKTAETIYKGWAQWGTADPATLAAKCGHARNHAGFGSFRLHLVESIRHVMGDGEAEAIFSEHESVRLLVFTTRLTRADGRPLRRRDLYRCFLQSMTRKFPRFLKLTPTGYLQDPVVFASGLPDALGSECVRPLTRENLRSVIQASCLVPIAMGGPLLPRDVQSQPLEADRHEMADEHAIFVDGGFSLKMPMGAFARDARFSELARWIKTDRTLVFCCDARGRLWETSHRHSRLETNGEIVEAVRNGRLVVLHPDHDIEASFLCVDNRRIMRTFGRGRAQAERIIKSRALDSFFDV